MITTIQLNKTQLEETKPLIEKFNAITYFNENADNSFLRLKDMLDIEFDDYRFHLHGDVIIADDLEKFLPRICKFMQINNILILSLSAPSLKPITAEYFLGNRVINNSRIGFSNLNNVGVIYTKKFVNMMKRHINDFPEISNDAEYINEVLNKTRNLSLLYLPILVHKKSLVHNLFQKDYIINMK